MKNKLKIYLTLCIALFAFLSAKAQCETIMKFFKDDMYTSQELIAFAEKDPQKAFDSWKVLYYEKTGLARNIEELNIVSKNLDEITKAGGYSKWKALQEIKDIVVKGDYLSHEYDQIIKLGKELGGGTAEFYKAQQGIEGIFTKLNGDKIPFSLKQVTPDLNSGNGVKNIFREIKDNASKIKDGYTNNDLLIKKYCQIGDSPNTYIRVDVTNMGKAEILQYYNSIEESRRVLLFGGEGVFKQIKIIDKNGEALIFDNYKLIQ